MRELKDRLYFFVPTRMSLGILLAYRDDLGELRAGCDVEDIYRFKSRDRDALIRSLASERPFARLIECKRGGKRLPIIFIRSFADRTAMYCAVELKCNYAQTLAATLQLGYGETVLTEYDASAASAASAADKMASDGRIYKYLNTIYGAGERGATPSDSPVAVADDILALCDFLGVQLELDVATDLGDRTELHFSFKRCMELAAVFACVARRYTKRRVLGVELCRCAYTLRVRFSLDFDSEESESEATDVLESFLRIMDVSISRERDGVVTYEAMPNEPELEVAGVKEEF